VTLFGACTLGAVVLATVMATLAILAVEAISVDVTLHEAYDYRRAIFEEREALRILRARYAAGLVSPEAYRRLTYELERGHAV
jgi:uncharacterized membrane protein